MLFRFEAVELDTDTYELRNGGVRVPVEPQVFEVLAYLVTHRDRLVARTEILDAIWGDRFVSDNAPASRVKAARAAIGDDGQSQRLIRTVHGRGLHQTIRFCSAPDGVQLAVATVDAASSTSSSDRLPLIKSPNWLTHVEKDWQSPVWAHWLTELAHRSMFVRYDARGGGLSDRYLQAPGSMTSTRGRPTSRPWSIPSVSIGSTCSACPKAQRRQWRMRCATPNASRI